MYTTDNVNDAFRFMKLLALKHRAWIIVPLIALDHRHSDHEIPDYLDHYHSHPGNVTKWF